LIITNVARFIKFDTLAQGKIKKAAGRKYLAKSKNKLVLRENISEQLFYFSLCSTLQVRIIICTKSLLLLVQLILFFFLGTGNSHDCIFLEKAVSRIHKHEPVTKFLHKIPSIISD